MEKSYIKLGDFLKINNIAQSGGEAKVLIQSGFVKVNGDIETRRGKKLNPGDIVSVNNQEFKVK
ncbi:RNA-binding S4 domain-containing protein [Peptoniphilus catoniae]|uniref:RNA-binding S4 domain-containing protein n=1 Tax=Peptoniphilus catoniae TaxID=1660341 RepID=UPI0010FDBCA2|nr:RNA-binding S4 domain-containing protein [Peptoniphilus catoniae]